MNTKISKPAKTGKKAAALGVQELALAGWLAADPGNRFAMAGGRYFACYEKLPPRQDGKRPVAKIGDWEKTGQAASLKVWFGGTIGCKPSRLADLGYFSVYAMLGTVGRNDRILFQEAVADIHIPGSWNLDSRYIALTASGEAWWAAEGREAHAAALDKIAAASARAKAAERRAVFGWVAGFDRYLPEDLENQLPRGVEVPLPKLRGVRPMVSAIIVRETAERYYVRDVRPIRQGESLTAHVGVREHNREHYIEKDRILLDHASDAAIASLALFDREQQQDHNERCRRAAEELIPILRRHAEAVVQNEAAHDDRLRDLLKGLSTI
ncbi:hypothetical protein G6L37_05910 [Agrobacterium rubi]|nr:hypothetical protein [Agrobacterium rubi]NTF24895.1 hypothetical protein [Agrobacterium rubi]